MNVALDYSPFKNHSCIPLPPNASFYSPPLLLHSRLHIQSNDQFDRWSVDVRANETSCDFSVVWEVTIEQKELLSCALGTILIGFMALMHYRKASSYLFSLEETHEEDVRLLDPAWKRVIRQRPSPLLLCEGFRLLMGLTAGGILGIVHTLHFFQFWSIYCIVGLPATLLYRNIGGTRLWLVATGFPLLWLVGCHLSTPHLPVGLPSFMYVGISLPACLLGYQLGKPNKTTLVLYQHIDRQRGRCLDFFLLALVLLMASTLLSKYVFLLFYLFHRQLLFGALSMSLGVLFGVQHVLIGTLALWCLDEPRKIVLNHFLPTLVTMTYVIPDPHMNPIHVLFFGVLLCLIANAIGQLSAKFLVTALEQTNKSE